MANKLNSKALGIASAVLTGISYILCFIIVLIFNEDSLKFFNLFFHGIDLTSLATAPNIVNGIIGLIISVIAAYAYGWILAEIYNKYTK